MILIKIQMTSLGFIILCISTVNLLVVKTNPDSTLTWISICDNLVKDEFCILPLIIMYIFTMIMGFDLHLFLK